MNSWSNGEEREPQGGCRACLPHSTSGCLASSIWHWKEGNKQHTTRRARLDAFLPFLSLPSPTTHQKQDGGGILCSYLALEDTLLYPESRYGCRMPVPQRGTYIVQITSAHSEVL